MKFKIKNNWKNGLFVEIIMILWVILFMRSLPWNNMIVTSGKILILSVLILLFIIGLPLLFIFVPCLNNKVSGCRTFIPRLIKYSKEHAGKTIKILLSYIAITIAAFLLYAFVFKFFLHKNWNSHAFFAVWCGLLILNTLFLLRDNLIIQKTEVAFALTCLTLGLLFIDATPEAVGYSPDDQIHYSHTMLISNVLGGVINSADEKQGTDEEAINNVTNKIGIDRESRRQYNYSQEEEYKKNIYSRMDENVSYWIVAYIPSAIGIIIGRGLGLSWAGIFTLGRLLNLIVYIVIFYYSIKAVTRGKLFLSVLGITPGLLILACNYSYDGWVTAFIVLGCSLLEKQLQSDKLINTKDWIVMLIVFVLGCLPKAVYFPIMFPILFVPHKKFSTRSQELLLKGMVFAAAILLLASFAVPTLVHGAGTGDARGGTDVNSAEQIEFILSEPIEYLKILVRFIWHYISIEGSAPGLTGYYYFGNGNFPYLALIVLCIAAFLDRPAGGTNTLALRVASWIGILGTLILICTSLYISFTAVKLDTIKGVQTRYLFPLLFMGLYSLGPDGVQLGKNKKNIYIVGFLLMSFIFIRDLYQVCIYAY